MMSPKTKKNLRKAWSVLLIRAPLILFVIICMRIGEYAEKFGDVVDSHFPGFDA